MTAQLQTIEPASASLNTANAAPPVMPWPERLRVDEKNLNTKVRGYESAGNYGVELAAALHTLAVVHEMQTRYDAATDDYKREISVLRKSVGPDHARTIDAMRSLAAVYEMKGEFEPARELYQQEYALWRAKFGPHDMHLAAPLHSLGAIAENKADYDEAWKYFEEELALHHHAFGLVHAANIPATRQLANIAEQKKDFRTAESLYLQELQDIEATMPRKTVLPANTHTRLGHLYEKTGDYRNSVEHLKVAIALLEPVSDADDPYIPELLKSLARVYGKEGRVADANDALAQADRIIKRAAVNLERNL